VKRSAKILGVGTVFGLVLSLTALVGPAAAGHVACGDVITEDTTLDSNVGPCTGTGLVIGADGVTLNLGGHRVFGTNQPGEGPGILIEDRQNVSVANGTVQFFDAGVAILGGGSNRVGRIQALDNVGSGATDFGDGIAVSDSADNLIVQNIARGNGIYSGIGIFGAASTGNVIDRNLVEGNDILTSPTGPQQDDGIRLEPFTSFNVVTNNRVYDNGLDGIAIFARSTDNVVRRNDIRRNGAHDQVHRQGDGIAVFNRGDRNLIEDNRVFDNGANGIFLRGTITTGSGVVIPGAMNNEILNNFTGNNGPIPGPGGPRFDLRDNNPNCDNNRWFGNTYLTAFPACTTVGGSGPPIAAAASAASTASVAASVEPEVGSTSTR
jgi:parallel beta-helix repeat protein